MGLRGHPGPICFIQVVRMRLYGLGIASLGRSVSLFLAFFQLLIDL